MSYGISILFCQRKILKLMKSKLAPCHCEERSDVAIHCSERYKLKQINGLLRYARNDEAIRQFKNLPDPCAKSY